MLSRLLPKPSNLRPLTLISSKLGSHLQPQFPSTLENPSFIFTPRFFSSSNHNGGNNGRDPFESSTWKFSRENDGNLEPFFGRNSKNDGGTAGTESDSWLKGRDGGDEWQTAEGYKPWSLAEEEKADLFDIGEDVRNVGENESESDVRLARQAESDRAEEVMKLEREEQQLSVVLKGPNRAFGDLIAASGITDDMLDSLIALKDFKGVDGLPPLSELEDLRYEKSKMKSTRADIERQKQEEAAKARVRQVDDKGRAYGTGRRKCSVARVWIQPGDGKFLVNEKEFDVYFPMLDHRAALLRPFSETKTLGLWDVTCTVKGGGTTGQVGAILLGISRALQNWEPDLRPPLREAGFLTRDPRMVERKKPGKAKARKSFQWVKR
ncbi:Ribosomal protein [Parasponia andersonii]|uniref:Ribosomal protein n=1 Tax=Parasponia andersonii TaxID=3476 RepID=A0A2P5ANC6_PARAD|nr:Ribosomal protein [Parasponia andersonii]